jgi:type II secretory pathway pseudopilin PulG
MLVVVLIIGILAAIALPQYLRTVEKSRFMQLITFSSAVKKAEQIYFLQNDTYTSDFTLLDIEMPPGGSLSQNNTELTFSNELSLKIHIEGGKAVCICAYSNKIQVQHCNYFDRHRTDCRAEAGNSFAASVCKSLGAVYNHTDTGDIDMYFF